MRSIRRDIARLKTIATEREKGIKREAVAAAPAAKKGKKSTARRPAKKGAAKTKSR